MRFNLIPRIAGGKTSWQWRMADNDEQELCASSYSFDTAEAAEAAVDHLMQQVRGEVTVIRHDPTDVPGTPWAETEVAFYQAEGDHSHGEDSQPGPEPV